MMKTFHCVVLFVIVACSSAADVMTSEKITSNIPTAVPCTNVTCPTILPFPKPVDCEEVFKNGHNKSGVYTVYPRNRLGYCSVVVYCDMETAGGGWTVIQRRGRFNEPMNYFAKRWEQYKEGFGILNREFWLGNDLIFLFTNQDSYTVRFEMKDWKGASAYATYDKFWIEDETEKYKLHISGYSGTAGDSMSYHNGMYFSTIDRHYDTNYYFHCAWDRQSGWWFNSCMTSNLNGLNKEGPYSAKFNDGIEWHSFRSSKNSLVATEIKIRPRRQFCDRSSRIIKTKASEPLQLVLPQKPV